MWTCAVISFSKILLKAALPVSNRDSADLLVIPFQACNHHKFDNQMPRVGEEKIHID